MKQNIKRVKGDIIIGLDLGQQNDYTVLSVLQLGYNKYQPKQRKTYSLLHLDRVPLHIPYTTVVNSISNITHNYLDGFNYNYVVDYTGVGRPIVDMLRDQGVKLIAVNITGGTSVNWKSHNEASVPKTDIITSLKVTLESSRLIISEFIDHLDPLIDEFVNFKDKKTKSANLQFEAGYGYHDDIVLSVGLAVWYGEHSAARKRRIQIMCWE